MGTITAAGLYTAPQNLPAQNPVSIQAVSQADNSKSATATVTVTSDIAVSVTPAAADVELGATRQFQASVSGSGNPNRTVTWSAAGVGCAGAACGTVDANGLFTAPPIWPSPPGVTLTAKSVADLSKSASAAVNITSSFMLSVAGP
ncbi:MAG: hypothetical protein HY237_15290, partial [Acidobacteria bacterium]|nr:hypothetical protein [Acidobacteriota bacterium]